MAPDLWAKYSFLFSRGQILGNLVHATLSPPPNSFIEQVLDQSVDHYRSVRRSIFQAAADYIVKRSIVPAGGSLVFHPYRFERAFWVRGPHFHFIGTMWLPPQQILGAFPAAWEFGSVYKGIRQLHSQAHVFGVLRYEIGHAGYCKDSKLPGVAQFGWAKTGYWRKDALHERVLKAAICSQCGKPHHAYSERTVHYAHKFLGGQYTLRHKPHTDPTGRPDPDDGDVDGNSNIGGDVMDQ